MISLFVGRFQPFHNGHLHDIRKALEFSDKVIIGVGSSQEKYTKTNPFSYEERKEMIEKTLYNEGIEDFTITGISDINDDKRWVEHVISIVGKVDIIYTGNPKVKKLFSEKGYDVRMVSFLEGVTATEIRKRMHNEGDWKDLVPPEVVSVIKKIKGVSRIRKINGFL